MATTQTYFVWVLAAVAASPAAAQTRYTVTDVGVLDGYSESVLWHGDQLLNESGQVAVTCFGDIHPCTEPPTIRRAAARYTPGVGLERVAAGVSADGVYAEAINEDGDIFVSAVDAVALAEIGPCTWYHTGTVVGLWIDDPATGTAPAPIPTSVQSSFGGIPHFGDDGSFIIAGFEPGLYDPASGWVGAQALDPLLTGPDIYGAGLVDRNGAGEVAGFTTGGTSFGFRWTPSGGARTIDAPTIQDGTVNSSLPVAINDDGLILGQYSIPQPNNVAIIRAFINRPDGTSVSIHDSSLAVGSAPHLLAGDWAAGKLIEADHLFIGEIFVWSPSTGMMEVLVDSYPTVYGAFAVNRHGTVVGHTAGGANGYRAWVWSPDVGLRYLDELVNTDVMWELQPPRDINDAGQIVLQAIHPDTVRVHTLLLTPACACELTGNGAVDVFDLLAYLDLWFAGDLAADGDSSGSVDVFDLLGFLDCWFAGC